MRWLLCCCLCFAASALAAITARDDRGKELTLRQPAMRIVTLSPHLAELVYAVGAGSRLVGVSAYSDYPAEAAKLPVIGRSGRVDHERLLALKPDLILAWKSGNHPGDIARLEQAGLPVWVTEPEQLSDVARLLRGIGRLTGAEPVAERAAQALEEKFAALSAHYRGKASVTVFYEVWHDPLMTINGKHMISSMIELCGGENVFAQLGQLTPIISREALLAADPAAIVTSAGVEREARSRWEALGLLRAIKAGRLYYVDPDLIQRQTPRLALGAEQLCQALDAARGSMAR